MNRMTIDRIEGNLAMCEADGAMKRVPLAALPHGVREGSVVAYRDGAWHLDESFQAKRESLIADKMRSLFKD